MFCGIGPYLCVLGRESPACDIVGVELNEDAFRYCVENIRANSLEGRCSAVHGNVVDIVPTLGMRTTKKPPFKLLFDACTLTSFNTLAFIR
jgi:tRNA G37 N-methylase Trm5